MGKKKEGINPLSLFSNQVVVELLGGGSLGLVEVVAVVGQAGLAHPMRQAISPALGAGGNAGSIQLPHGAAALVPTLLGNFALGDCHIDTSLKVTGA